MLSYRIAKLRKNIGMSQAQFAKELNISASAEGMYEQGRRTPNLDVLVLMARILNVSLDYLITGEDCTYSGNNTPLPRSPDTCPCNSCYWKERAD